MTSMTAKVSTNYTEEMIDTIVAEYTANPSRDTVDNMAELFTKSARSIIAKLSAIGIYQKPVAVTKRGEPVVKKEVFIQQIQDSLGVAIPSLDKVTKVDLELLLAALSK
jgi:hypothetical protein